MFILLRHFVLLFLCYRLCFAGTTDLLLPPYKDTGISNTMALSPSVPHFSAPYQAGGLQSYPHPGGYLTPVSSYPNHISQLPPARNCPDVCPLIFEPVCAASNNHLAQTFSNRCFLQMYNCRNNQHLQVIALGPCLCNAH